MRRTRKKSKILRNVVFIVITLSVVIAPAILTSKFGFGFSPILTGSMRPTANPGDVFLTRLALASDLKLGDVIAVNNPTTGFYYSHRIIQIRDFNGAIRVITKGDANESADRDPFVVSPSGEVSKVVKTIPLVGRPMVYMNSVQGRQTASSFLVIANVFGLVAFLFRRKIVASRTPERVYRELYEEERRSNERNRGLISRLPDAPAIEGVSPNRIGTKS
jgi:signal peptidase